MRQTNSEKCKVSFDLQVNITGHSGPDHSGPDHSGPDHSGPDHSGPEHKTNYNIKNPGM